MYLTKHFENFEEPLKVNNLNEWNRFLLEKLEQFNRFICKTFNNVTLSCLYLDNIMCRSLESKEQGVVATKNIDN